MTRRFQLDYDRATRVLTLSSGTAARAWVPVSDEVEVALDPDGRQIAALRIAQLPWFVDYHLIARLLGHEAVTPLSQFQSDVVDRHERGIGHIEVPVRPGEHSLLGAGPRSGLRP